MDNVYFRQNQGEKLLRPWKHLDRIKRGEGILVSKEGELVVAQSDGFIVMPNASAKDGEDWIYFGKSKKV